MLPRTAQSVADALVKFQAVKPCSVQQHGPGVRLHDAANQIEQRGLAGPVRADQPDNAASVKTEVDVVCDDDPVEALAHVLDFEHASHQRCSAGLSDGARQMSLTGTRPCGRKNMKTSTRPVNRRP